MCCRQRSEARQLDVAVSDLLALLRDPVRPDDRSRHEGSRTIRARMSGQSGGQSEGSVRQRRGVAVARTEAAADWRRGRHKRRLHRRSSAR